MRSLVLASGCLLLAGLAIGKCTVVGVRNAELSSRDIEITVLRDSKPLRNVKLIVCMADEEPRLSLATGDGGAARLPPLPPGHCHIVATDSGGLEADLLWDVSGITVRKTSSFLLDLLARPVLSRTLSQKIASAENQPFSKKLKEFQGVVFDPSGAVVPGAKIEIFQRGSSDKEQTAKIATDATGHFSAHLNDGRYTAIIQWPGSSAQIQVFNIFEAGDNRDVRIVLKLAPRTLSRNAGREVH